MYTRREFGKVALTSVSLAAAARAQSAGTKFASKISGVQFGVETYSYRSLRDDTAPYTASNMERLVDRVADAFVQDGIDCCEFWIGMIEPGAGRFSSNPAEPAAVKARESLRQWRKGRPLDILRYARRKFDDAGVNIYSCAYNLGSDSSDDELDCAFDMANALGVKIISANCTVKSIRRVVPFADKHQMIVGIHGENMPGDPEPDGMVYADNLAAAMELSRYIWTSPDTGHMRRYNTDVVKFIHDYPDRIACVHLKDGLKNHPEIHSLHNTPEWGKGDVPFREVLQLMKNEKYPFPAMIEYEYAGKGTAVEEVRRCLDFCRTMLT